MVLTRGEECVIKFTKQLILGGFFFFIIKRYN